MHCRLVGWVAAITNLLAGVRGRGDRSSGMCGVVLRRVLPHSCVNKIFSCQILSGGGTEGSYIIGTKFYWLFRVWFVICFRGRTAL
jgi:hypothetical protein